MTKLPEHLQLGCRSPLNKYMSLKFLVLMWQISKGPNGFIPIEENNFFYKRRSYFANSHAVKAFPKTRVCRLFSCKGQTWTLKAGVVFVGGESLLLLSQPGGQGLRC